MNPDSKPATYLNLNDVELGFVVNLKIFREVLKGLRANGRRWWVATDPCDAVENGFIRVGYGDPHCRDLLSTIYFRLPVLNDSIPLGGTDRIILVFDGGTCGADQQGVYRGAKGGVEQDDLQDFVSFFTPLKMALIERMQTGE